MRVNHSDPESRPVSAMCCMCRQVQAVGEQWYPFAAAEQLLADDVVFSHGVCPTCLEAQGVPAELC